MFRNRSADVHQFSMIPRADIPRSSFRIQHTHKTTFDAGLLIPVYVDEVLPGDTFNLKMTIFARLATPIYPIMDNMTVDSFFFFVPNRLVWTNWVKFMGEQANPADTISYLVPQMAGPSTGYAIGSIGDYFGLPTVGQWTSGQAIGINAMPFRGYNLIWNQWFRDENLQNSAVVDLDDGPDSYVDYPLKRRGKRHDYFTSCLPWVQKGAASVSLPLGSSAPVKTSAGDQVTGAQAGLRAYNATGAGLTANRALGTSAVPPTLQESTTAVTGPGVSFYPSNLYADLSAATAATINQIRQAFQIQRLLERDARGGTRYTEIVRSHFGVISPDARLQRPEFLGGGSTAVNVSPIAQTESTVGGSTPLATLSAIGTVVGPNHGFTQSFTEHGYVIGLISVRADLTYQQGVRRMWDRRSRYDFYFPVFSHLGEQAVTNREIYATSAANDALVFGYQERWAEYRHNPSKITGLFRSTAAGTLDGWHLAQRFSVVPTLNATFIEDDPPVDRVIAVPAEPHFKADMFFDVKAARPLPMYSVPGLVDHF